MKNSSFALITGASRGLGEVFARALAARKQNVILVARSKDKLESLAGELKRSQSVLAEALECDLTSDCAGSRLTEQLRGRKLQVNLLVNNAGFGVRGEFFKLPLERQMEMLRLNGAAVIELIPGFVNKLSVFAQRLIPRRAVPKLVAKMSRQ